MAPPPRSDFLHFHNKLTAAVVGGAPPMRPAHLWSHPRPVEFLEPVHDPSFDDSETDLINP